MDARDVAIEEMDGIKGELTEILEGLEGEPLDMVYEGDFEESYTYYDEEDIEAKDPWDRKKVYPYSFF